MLLTLLITGSLLLVLSRYRVWVLFAVGGAAFSGALLAFASVMVRFLPDELRLFDGVLSFLLLSGCLIWLTSWTDTLSGHDHTTG